MRGKATSRTDHRLDGLEQVRGNNQGTFRVHILRRFPSRVVPAGLGLARACVYTECLRYEHIQQALPSRDGVYTECLRYEHIRHALWSSCMCV
jgi:hypothetical protein